MVILVPLLVGMMLFIARQYAERRARAGRPTGRRSSPPPHREERVVVPIPGLDRASVQAINVARSIDDDVRAVFISRRPRGRGRACAPTSSARCRACPWSSSSRRTGRWPARCVAYLDVLDLAWPPDKAAPITFVVIPEYVARSWWERLLYNQSAKRLRTMLLGRPHTVIVNVPYRRDDPEPTIAGDATSAAAGDAPGLAGDPHELREVPPRPDVRGLAGVDRPDRHPRDGQAEGDAAGDHLDLELEAGLVAVEQRAPSAGRPMSR